MNSTSASTPPSARDLFLEALEMPAPAERAAFLDRACRGDSILRAAVEDSPRLPGRTYSVRKNSSLLSTPWISLTEAAFTDNGAERTVTDPHATEARSFYRVDITRP